MSNKVTLEQIKSKIKSEMYLVLPDGKNISRFSGRVNGEAMEGMVDLPGGKGMAKWTAVRTAEAKVVME